MTDKQTLSLNASEWRGLLMQNLVQAHEFAQGAHRIGPAEVKGLHERLDRMKALVTAWYLSAPQIQDNPANTAMQDAVHMAAEQAESPNAESRVSGPVLQPRKKPGWPAGKKRGPRKQQAQVVQ